MFIDEVENYLPEQVSLLKCFMNPRTNAMIYVGDLAQQTSLCTMRSWDAVGEVFPEGRSVLLQKTYRSTKEILQYIKNIGYSQVYISEGSPSGAPVAEAICSTVQEEIVYVKSIIDKNQEKVIGVLAKSSEYLQLVRDSLKDFPNVQILSISEAQGVEFEIVCFIGLEEALYISEVAEGDSEDFTKERIRVSRDLIYVALTRAMQELHVIGRTPLKLIVDQLVQAIV